MKEFNTSLYQSGLKSTYLGQEFVVFPELESTNSWLKSAPSDTIVDGMICLTDHQVKGRGQYDRSWASEPNVNLTWSFLMRPDTHDRLFLLTLANIHAVANVMERIYGLETMMKWPNDLIVRGKKVAGVLAEAVFNVNHLDRFIVGIGLNVNQATFPAHLAEAASLSQLLGRPLVRERLLAEIVNECDNTVRAWKQKDLALVKNINQRLIGYGSKVRVEVDGVLLEGEKLLLGVNVNGHLHLMDDNYTVHTYTYEQVRIFTDTV